MQSPGDSFHNNTFHIPLISPLVMGSDNDAPRNDLYGTLGMTDKERKVEIKLLKIQPQA